MSAVGDVLAQGLVRWELDRENRAAPAYVSDRTLRMFGFGLLFYGPFQHLWYGALAHQFPGTGVTSFLIKVTLNQVVLGPIVLTTAFAWNLWLQGKAAELQPKLKKDLVPTMINGWKFWVPAACINFYAVPLRFQVLFSEVLNVAMRTARNLARTCHDRHRPRFPQPPLLMRTTAIGLHSWELGAKRLKVCCFTLSCQRRRAGLLRTSLRSRGLQPLLPLHARVSASQAFTACQCAQHAVPGWMTPVHCNPEM